VWKQRRRRGRGGAAVTGESSSSELHSSEARSSLPRSSELTWPASFPGGSPSVTESRLAIPCRGPRRRRVRSPMRWPEQRVASGRCVVRRRPADSVSWHGALAIERPWRRWQAQAAAVGGSRQSKRPTRAPSGALQSSASRATRACGSPRREVVDLLAAVSAVSENGLDDMSRTGRGSTRVHCRAERTGRL